MEKVTRVALREVWAREAVDFTPWLLKNLDFLNEVLPFELVEAEREKAAGTSWVDVVAKDTQGGTVVIENQLGTSDHDHLGKVITYLATYEAKRAIWIVGDARPEHIEAINWLNKMGPVDSFLVTAEALRIGNSEPAAQFEVITGPSEPLRTAGDTKRRQASTEPRSLRDAIDECKCFDRLPKGKRHEAARMTDYAIRLLWHRTGASLDAFAPRRTHAETLGFLKRHRRIVECVKLILTENSGKENKIGCYVSTGYAAGLLYLFGSSATDPAAYNAAESPSEELLNWDRWSAACDFFVQLAGRSRDMAAVHDALARRIEKAEVINNAVRWAILVKAWNVWSRSGKAIKPKDMELEYTESQDGEVDSPTHWSLYAPGGVAIGFALKAVGEGFQTDEPRPARAPGVDRDPSNRLMRCRYAGSFDLQSLVAERFFGPNSCLAAFASPWEIAHQIMWKALAVSVYQVICTIKGASFEDDKEWRVVHINPERDKYPVRCDERNRSFITLRFDPSEYVRELWVGPHNNQPACHDAIAEVVKANALRCVVKTSGYNALVGQGALVPRPLETRAYPCPGRGGCAPDLQGATSAGRSHHGHCANPWWDRAVVVQPYSPTACKGKAKYELPFFAAC